MDVSTQIWHSNIIDPTEIDWEFERKWEQKFSPSHNVILNEVNGHQKWHETVVCSSVYYDNKFEMTLLINARFEQNQIT